MQRRRPVICRGARSPSALRTIPACPVVSGHGHRRHRLAFVLLAGWFAIVAMTTTDAGTGTTFTDFGRLALPASPNRWLVAPAGVTAAAPDETAPMFEFSADRLVEAWTQVIKGQPRTRITAVSTDGLQIEAEQKTALFGFVDRISIRAIPLTPTRSTFAAYSRAETGYWDLGVNRNRLRTWLAELRAKLDAAPTP